MDKLSTNWEEHLKRLEGAYAANTIKSYYADISQFVDWCRARQLEPFPLTSGLAVAYLEHIQGRMAYPSIRRCLSALRRIHKLLELEDGTRGEDVHLTIRRIKRSKCLEQSQAAGINHGLLTRMIAAQPNSLAGIRNRALLSVGYDFLARRSELTSLRHGDLTFGAGGTLRGVIRRGKTDQFGRGRLVFGSKRSSRLLGAWLKLKPAEVSPVFCAINHGNCLGRALCGRSVSEIIKGAAAKVKCAERPDDRDISGHSLRVGAAQDLLIRGYGTAAIMRAGGWTNMNTLSRYLRYAQHNIWE